MAARIPVACLIDRRARQSSRPTTSAAIACSRLLEQACDCAPHSFARPIRTTPGVRRTGGIADVNPGADADHQPITATIREKRSAVISCTSRPSNASPNKGSCDESYLDGGARRVVTLAAVAPPYRPRLVASVGFWLGYLVNEFPFFAFFCWLDRRYSRSGTKGSAPRPGWRCSLWPF